jgi:AbiTii-like protein
MSKLDDIIEAATMDSVSVPALLRMTKVLAARMETPPLVDWVDNELTGYPMLAVVNHPGFHAPSGFCEPAGWLASN